MKKFYQFINENNQLSPEDSLKVIASMIIDVFKDNSKDQLNDLITKVDKREGEGCTFELFLTQLYSIREYDNLYEVIPTIEEQLKNLKEIESLRDLVKGDISLNDNLVKNFTEVTFWVEYKDLMSDEVQNFIKSSSQIKKFNL